MDNEHNRPGRILSGLIIVGVGTILLMRQLGTLFPGWLFTWQMLVIVIGSYIGVRHGFRWGGWVVVVLAGILLGIEQMSPSFRTSELFWPLIIIAIGLFIVFRPKKRWKGKGKREGKDKWKSEWKEKHGWDETSASSTEDRIDSVSIFGGVRRVIVSKDFKGGEITNIFGGAEIDLSQADINGRVSLEMTQVFGGTNIIVPPHWQIMHGDLVSIMGSIEDKRSIKEGMTNPDKVLVLHGTSVMAGIDIRSY